jgi:hypothetical protein
VEAGKWQVVKTLARDGCLAEIVARLRTLRPDTPGRWGRMSSHQMICHLADGCRMAIGQKTAVESGGLFHRTVLKGIVLYGPLRWPAGVPTSPELDQRHGGTTPADFAADLSGLQRLLGCLCAQPQTFRWPSHPLFGQMSRAQWLRWGYLHADHHLRQFGA